MPTTESSEAPVTGAPQSESRLVGLEGLGERTADRWQDRLPPPETQGKKTPARECALKFWRYHSRRMLPVQTSSAREVWVLNPVGLWEPAVGDPVHWSVDAALAAFMPEHSHSEVNTAFKEVKRFAFMEGDVESPSSMNSNLRYMAAPNGVIDLIDGVLIDNPRRASALRVTTERVTRDPFVPGADEDPHVEEWLDRLFWFVDDDLREWLLASLGFALHGDPAKRIHVLTGPTGAGKTTIVQAAVHALGSYGAKGRPESINRYGRISGFEDAGVWFDGVRVSVFDELDGVTLNASKLKDYSSGGIGTKEVKYNDPDHRAEITATAFLSCNDDQVRSMGAEQQAMSDRLFITRLDGIPPKHQNREIPQMFQHDPGVRKGMLARLVRYASTVRTAPEETDSGRVERERRIEEDLGIVGYWLRSHVVVHDGDSALLNNDILRAMKASPDDAVSAAAGKLDHGEFGRMLGRYVDGWEHLPVVRHGRGKGRKGASLSGDALSAARAAEERIRAATRGPR